MKREALNIMRSNVDFIFVESQEILVMFWKEGDHNHSEL